MTSEKHHIRRHLKKVLPRTLFGRSLLILVIPVLLIQIITTFVFFDRHWNKMTDRLAFAVAGEIAIIADQIEQGVSEDAIKKMSGYAAQSLHLLVSYEQDGVWKEQETKEAGRHSSSLEKVLAKAIEFQVRRPFRIEVDLQEKWIAIAIALDNGVLYVSSPQRRLFSSSGYIFLLWMIGASLVLLAIAILFMRNQIRPIRRLAVAAERFGKGQGVPAGFKPEGAREVRQAAQAFLDMHDRIRRQMEQRTTMLAGISHDLRTPLTRMKLQTAMMGDSPDVDALKTDILDMERMIAAYLDFVRGEGEEQNEYSDLAEILRRVVMNAKRQEIDTELDVKGDLSLSVRPVAFERCLNNIISNAKKYANSRVWIAARRLHEIIEITVDDDGKGVPEEKMGEVFKPFYRVESSRNPMTGGVGLGLPIAQDIVHSHGGEIWLEKSNRGGLRVVIHLPI